MRRLLPILALLIPLTAVAQEAPPDDAPAPPPPPLIEDGGIQPGDTVEPQVTIIRREGETIEEYRLHGQIYMIRVVPAAGPPYYLVDSDGDGHLESTMNELDPRIMIPAWVIFRW